MKFTGIGDHMTYALGSNIQFKFKDLAQVPYHLEELDPVREHSEQFEDLEDELNRAKRAV